MSYAEQLDALHAEHDEILAHARAKIDECVDGLDSAEIARIEREHKSLLASAESVERQINKRQKPWAAQFLMSAAAGSGLTTAQLSEIVAMSDSHNTAKEQLVDMMHKEHNANKPPAHPSAGGFADPNFTMQAATDAMYALVTGRQIEGPGKELAAGGVRRVLHSIATARGEKVDPWLSAARMVEKFFMAGGPHSTSDFPNILGSAFNRVLLEAYQPATSALLQLARQRDVADFRDINLVRLGEAAQLQEVAEGGEIKFGTRADDGQKYRVGTYAGLFALTRQALQNDNLGAFNDPVTDFGRAAAATLADKIASVLTDNSGDGQDLEDGSPVYSTTRGNKATSGDAIDVDTVGAARQGLRSMKGLDGKTPIAATPKFLVVGPAKETEAEKVLHTLSAVQVEDVNPFGGALTLAVEPRLSGNAWRLFADPTVLPCFEVAFLNGQRAPFMETRAGWEVLATEFRCVFDFGVAMTDWRGTYLNPGN